MSCYINILRHSKEKIYFNDFKLTYYHVGDKNCLTRGI